MTTTPNEKVLLSTLDDVYGVMRKVQGGHNENPSTAKTKCIGSGNCCKIGLVIPFFECLNIAKNLRREYWIKYELEGKSAADIWYNKVVFKLKDAFEDPDWKVDDETATKRKCPFFKNKSGCTVYEFRPFICRAYGTITPVDNSCPRPRDENGNVIIFLSTEIDQIIKQFESIIEAYGKENPQLNYSVFMPLGVLRFLLHEKEFYDFTQTVDKKFLQAREGYPHQLWKARSEASGK